MSQSIRMKRKPAWLVYTTALLTPAVATVLRMSLSPLLGPFGTPFIAYFPAVIFVAATCGFRAATITILLSSLAAGYYFIPPAGAFLILHPADGAALLLFISISFGIAWFTHARRRALEQADRELELRRAAESTERSLRERFATTLTSVGDAVISTDAEGRIVFANPVAQSILQWPEAEILGRHLDEVFRIINEDSRATVESPVAKVLREGGIVGLANHTVLIARDGTEIPIDDSGAPIRGEGGAIEGTVLVFRDVTVRRRQESASRLLASIVESSDDAIISKDLNAVITSWNKGAERMFEYSAAEAIGQPIALLAAAERADEMPGILERIKQGERIDHFETVRRTKSGKLVHVSLTISPLRNSTGRIVGASKIARDISERVRAAEHMASLNALLRESNERLARANDGLQESEQRFRRLADGAPVMIWVAGLDKKYTWLNAVWLKFTGRTMAQEIGDGWTERIHPDDRERCLATYSENFDRREIFSMEYRLLRHDGEWRWLLDCGMPLQGPDGTFAGYVGSCIDITERKQNEEERAELLARERAARAEAERANRLKDEFLATVSHELRTPLAAVLGWAQLLQNSGLDETSRNRALKAIDHNAKMQAKLLEDILDVSRVVSGKLLLDIKPV
jgi:PAS domain S-box-containing protein